MLCWLPFCCQIPALTWPPVALIWWIWPKPDINQFWPSLTLSRMLTQTAFDRYWHTQTRNAPQELQYWRYLPNRLLKNKVWTKIMEWSDLNLMFIISNYRYFIAVITARCGTTIWPVHIITTSYSEWLDRPIRLTLESGPLLNMVHLKAATVKLVQIFDFQIKFIENVKCLCYNEITWR